MALRAAIYVGLHTLDEHVADTPHRADALGLASVVAELVAQVRDVHIHRPVDARIVARTALLPGEHYARELFASDRLGAAYA